MKYYKIIGFSACILLIISCFLPWAYYADIQKTFNGFFSEGNNYGKPGKFFVFFGIVSIIFIVINKTWAKRVLLFFSAINVGYVIKTYILFTSCYNTYCPEKRIGLYLLMLSSAVIMLASLFPDININAKKDPE
ncbi:MAG: hypothetical protein ABIR19_01655 [Ginsengibacter sp.]